MAYLQWENTESAGQLPCNIDSCLSSAIQLTALDMKEIIHLHDIGWFLMELLSPSVKEKLVLSVTVHGASQLNEIKVFSQTNLHCLNYSSTLCKYYIPCHGCFLCQKSCRMNHLDCLCFRHPVKQMLSHLCWWKQTSGASGCVNNMPNITVCGKVKKQNAGEDMLPQFKTDHIHRCQPTRHCCHCRHDIGSLLAQLAIAG